MPGTNPATLRSESLGAGLREAREKTPGSLGVRDVAQAMGYDHSNLSRFESGKRRPKLEQVEHLLDYYVERGLQLDPATREDLIDLARARENDPWIATTVPAQSRQLDALLKLEPIATQITDMSPLLIPGLLQTTEYTRAIMARGEVPEHQIETRIAVRAGRQRVLRNRTNPTRLLALINQSVLRQRIGGPHTMKEQLQVLQELAELPNVDLRIVPDNTDWHPGLEGPFVLLEFEDRPAIVHIEIRDNGLFLGDVAPYISAAQKVLREAMSHDESIQLIAREAEQIT